jgi:peptide/nickel transport system substrate-binding protein
MEMSRMTDPRPGIRITRRAALSGAALAGAALLARPARAAAKPGHLNFGLSTYPPTIQPWANSGGAAATVKLLIYRSLLSYDRDGKLRGELAESWDRDGETGWRFVLRDATFQNGKPVTSADVKWTLQQVAAEKSTAYLRNEFQGVADIATPDARTVIVTMKQPTATLPLWLASAHMPIIAAGSTDNGGTPVAAGPFAVSAQERGVSIDLVASDKYYRPGLPKLKTLRLVAYPDESLRVAALLSGDVDLIEYVPWQSFDTVQKNPALKLDSTLGPFMNLLFNGHSGPFADARVRLAVAHAVRREEIVRAVFFGRGAPLEGMPLPPGSDYYDAASAHAWNYDPDKAKSLLAAAGLGSGFTCNLLATAQYTMHKDTAEIVQQHLAEIGVQATLSLPEWGQRVALGNRGQYEFAVFGTTADSNDPDGLAPMIDSELSPSYVRSYDMPTPELHKLFAAGRAEFDDSKRHAIYSQVTQVFLQTAPMVTLAWRDQAYGMAKYVQGFKNMPGALSYFSGLTLEETSVS